MVIFFHGVFLFLPFGKVSLLLVYSVNTFFNQYMILFPLLVTIFADQFADFGPDGAQLSRFEFGAILVRCSFFFDECYSLLFGSCILKSFLFQKFIFFMLKTDSSLLTVGGIVDVLLLLSLLCCQSYNPTKANQTNACITCVGTMSHSLARET